MQKMQNRAKFRAWTLRANFAPQTLRRKVAEKTQNLPLSYGACSIASNGRIAKHIILQLIGIDSISGYLKSWANEGRFVWHKHGQASGNQKSTDFASLN